MCLEDAPGYCEPQARAAHLAGLEGLEEAGHQLGRNARSAVVHQDRDARLPALPQRLRGHGDRPLLADCLHCVLEHVDERLLEVIDVGADLREGRRGVILEGDAGETSGKLAGILKEKGLV